MLPAASRMRSSKQFATTTRNGVRSARGTVVVHAFRGQAVTGGQVGFVVSKRVGNAVVRNRVKRRLRHFASSLLASISEPTWFVVRATPLAANEPSRVGADIESAWHQCLRRLEEVT